MRKILFFCLCVVSFSCYASRWQSLGGESDTSMDQSFLDLDSISQSGPYRIVELMTVYEKARVNSKNVKLDRHIQKTAFDCAQKSFSPISMVGFLEGKEMGASPLNPDWSQQFKPLPRTPFSERTLALVCNAPIPGAPQVGGRAVPATLPPVAPPKPKLSSGSGIVVTQDGYVLTNFHVVNGCKNLTVKDINSVKGVGQVEAVDPKNDLALIKTPMTFDRVANFRAQSEPEKLGEPVGVVGYPLTGLLSAEPKATFGQISSVAGMNNDYSLLQISAPVQPGNSGGPVLDEKGSVIGVVVSQASLAVIALTGSVPQNINFAIRGELAQIFLQAHRIKYSMPAHHLPKLETQDVAASGQQFTTFILCERE